MSNLGFHDAARGRHHRCPEVLGARIASGNSQLVVMEPCILVNGFLTMGSLVTHKFCHNSKKSCSAVLHSMIYGLIEIRFLPQLFQTIVLRLHSPVEANLAQSHTTSQSLLTWLPLCFVFIAASWNILDFMINAYKSCDAVRIDIGS